MAGGRKRNSPGRVKTGGTDRQHGSLDFFDCDRVYFANFHAAFAAQAFFRIHDDGFSVPKLEHFNRAYIDALFAAHAFFFINNRIKSHLKVSFLIKILNFIGKASFKALKKPNILIAAPSQAFLCFF